MIGRREGVVNTLVKSPEEVAMVLRDALWSLKQKKEEEGRSEKARYLAVSITELEKAIAYLECWVVHS
jgi:hypothetical protein